MDFQKNPYQWNVLVHCIKTWHVFPVQTFLLDQLSYYFANIVAMVYLDNKLLRDEQVYFKAYLNT